MVFEDRGEDLQRLTQNELADRAADLYVSFMSGIGAIDQGVQEMRANPSFRRLVALNAAFTDRLRDADHAARHYSEALRKAHAVDEHMAIELYEHRLQELAEQHARLAGLWNQMLKAASEQNIFLPGGALLLAQKAKDTVEESLPTIRATITRLSEQQRTVAGLVQGVSEEERNALGLDLDAVRIQCQEGQSLARSAALDAREGSAAKVAAERLINEIDEFVELLNQAYQDAERNHLLSGGGNR